jgi:hypothetical protein
MHTKKRGMAAEELRRMAADDQNLSKLVSTCTRFCATGLTRRFTTPPCIIFYVLSVSLSASARASMNRKSIQCFEEKR